MEEQMWLPPLNSHPNFYTLISAKQVFVEENGKPPISKREPMFSILIKVMVKFYSERSTKKHTLSGLSLIRGHCLPASKITSVSPTRGKNKILALISEMRIGFDLKNIFFKRKHFGENADVTWEDEDVDTVLEKILDFLCSMRRKPCNVGRNRLPLHLNIKKMVCIPDSQFRGWISWYREKNTADGDFERRYLTEIGRPRTYFELVEYLTYSTNAASESAIEALEVVTVGESSSVADTDCLVCLENLKFGSKACRMPCSHVFHKECAVNWLQESHKCPICRFELPRK